MCCKIIHFSRIKNTSKSFLHQKCKKNHSNKFKLKTFKNLEQGWYTMNFKYSKIHKNSLKIQSSSALILNNFCLVCILMKINCKVELSGKWESPQSCNSSANSTCGWYIKFKSLRDDKKNKMFSFFCINLQKWKNIK